MSSSTGTDSGLPTKAASEKRPGVLRRWSPWIKRFVTIAFLSLVTVLIVHHARQVNWGEVWEAIQERPRKTILIAGVLCLASHSLYSCFDLIGRHVTGHQLKTPQVIRINFISYAFNLNLGSLVGGMGFRYRLYTRLGLELNMPVRIFAMSMLTNWTGYMLIAGLAFWLWPISLPPNWKIDDGLLRYLGMLVFFIALAYPVLCGLSHGRKWNLGKHEVALPSWRIALLQLAISIVNWMLIAAVLYVLLRQEISYALVLEVFLVSAVAGVITHVPAGLGVIETVFVALLAHRVPESDLLAALLVFRALYYLVPLAIAIVLYFLFEIKRKPVSGD